MIVRGELKSIVNDRIFILDLDRCLITSVLYDLFTAVVEARPDVDVNLLRDARTKVEASGGSFDGITWLLQQEMFNEEQHIQLLEEYIARAHQVDRSKLLGPGADSLLNALHRHAIPHMIMTYGGKENQIAKLRAARLDDVPYVVVDHPHKSQYIHEWWSDSKAYYEVLINGKSVVAKSVVLVDDKATAFDNLPEAPLARGYWLQAQQLLPSQEGKVPANVSIIKSLSQIVTEEDL